MNENQLNKAAINNELFRRALYNPWTALPLAIIIFAAVELVVFELFPQGLLWNLLSVILFLASAAIILGSFVGKRCFLHDEHYGDHLRLRLQRQDQRRAEAASAAHEEMLADLKSGFSVIPSEAGLKALNSVINEYDQIQPIIEKQRGTDQILAANIPSLAARTYRQGLTCFPTVSACPPPSILPTWTG